MDGFEKVSSVSSRLKEAMSKAGMKQVDLVKSTGIDKGSISYYISGRYEPKQIAVYKLAKALDVSEMWLWGYDCPMERPAEQKENDLLADIVDRMQKEKDFRQMIIKINHLKPEQVDILNKLLDQLIL